MTEPRTESFVIYRCPECGGIDGYPNESLDPGTSTCFRTHDSGRHPIQERMVVARVSDIRHWLAHIDRLDEIDGAAYPGLTKNPLWDAAFAMERAFTFDGTDSTGAQQHA